MGAVATRPADGGTDGFWDLYSRYYDAIYQLMPYRKLLWDTLQALDLQPGMRVLDAGCGTGNFEAFIAEKDHPPVEIEAVDFSRRMLQVAQTKCAGVGAYTFSQADLDLPLPFPDAHFDRILSINVLYALGDPDATLHELVRVLKPDGLMVLTSPLPEFRIRPLVADHFRRVRNIHGLGRQIRRVTRSILVLATSGVAQALLDHYVIGRRESEGRYRSLNLEGFTSLLERGRASGVGGFQITPALAGQGLMATARAGEA
jgi:ubiquinone/menaquinone biosynthesis C-methylase UbiE